MNRMYPMVHPVLFVPCFHTFFILCSYIIMKFIESYVMEEL